MGTEARLFFRDVLEILASNDDEQMELRYILSICQRWLVEFGKDGGGGRLDGNVSVVRLF
jgi:hypothetical protein